MSELILEVPDISCAHCERAIVEALQPHEGVQNVQVNIPARTVRLDLDEPTLPLDQVRSILDEEGYPVAAVRAA